MTQPRRGRRYQTVTCPWSEDTSAMLSRRLVDMTVPTRPRCPRDTYRDVVRQEFTEIHDPVAPAQPNQINTDENGRMEGHPDASLTTPSPAALISRASVPWKTPAAVLYVLASINARL